MRGRCYNLVHTFHHCKNPVIYGAIDFKPRVSLLAGAIITIWTKLMPNPEYGNAPKKYTPIEKKCIYYVFLFMAGLIPTHFFS
jgi:hypothetical protein